MNISALIDVLPIIAKGLGGVFAVIVLIWVSVVALTKLYHC